MPSKETLMLIDGHAAAYRAFYAIRDLSAPDGTPTNAIFGFVKALLRVREHIQPTHLAVVWDGGLDEKRTEILPGYKSERDPMPDALEVQLNGMVEWLEATGIASICEDCVEADDAIATLARQAEVTGCFTIILSPDKDFMQLVNKSIGILNPNDKTGTIWRAEQVFNKSGVQPKQIVDWLSLVGDAIDDIPGVSGVGPKTAAKWLGQFGSLDGLLDCIEEIQPERFRIPLVDMRADLIRNQQLVRLRENLPLPTAFPDCSLGNTDHDQLRSLYTRWGFKSLYRELEASRQQNLL